MLAFYFVGKIFKRLNVYKSTERGDKEGGRRGKEEKMGGRKGRRDGLKLHFLGKTDVYSPNWKKS